MKKKKIIFGVNDMLVGGMQRQLVEQFKFFDREKYDLVLITLFQFDGKDTFYNEIPEDVEVIKFNFSGIKDIKNHIKLYKKLKELKPDLVVTSLFFSNTVFRFLKTLLRYPIIICEHNTYIDKKKSHQILDRYLSKITDRIIAVSTTVAEFTSKQEKIPLEKFSVILNGVNVDNILKELNKLPSKEKLREENNFSVEETIYVNVARLTPQKNHKLLISGFHDFSMNNKGHKLIIVGGGGLYNELNELVKNLNTSSIILIGDTKEVYKYYKMADYFISSSLIEGLSISYLEAFSSSLPIISTITAGTDELVEDGKNGLYIKKHSRESIKETLLSLSKYKYLSLSENAFNTALKYDIKKNVEQYEELFNEVFL